MPQIIPAVVAAISYVGTATAAVVAGTATLAQIATVAAVGVGAGVGSMAVSKALTPEIGSQGAAVRWEANPDAPLRFPFGRVGVKGNIIDAAVYGPDRMYVSFACTVGAAGPIKRFVTFRAGDYIMSFNGAGQAVNEPYAGEMWLSTRLGAQPDTALSLPSGLKNGAAFPGWNSGRRLSASAAYLVTLGENSKRSAYDGKIPAFLAVIEGLFCYDPRLDSTYPGGAGSCRLNNPATWVWTENPILFGLKWALGLWEGPTGKGAPQVDYQVGGIGAKVEGIYLPSFVEAANVSDANGWKAAAWPSTDDDKAQVLDGFLKAGGSSYAEIGGKIACIHRAAPRAPVFTVTARDTAGPIEIDTASSKLNRINTIRPRYWSEAHEWEMTALPEVTSTVWQEEDGQGVAVKRTRGADYTFVPLPKQTRELASLEISNSREGIRGRVPLRPYMDPEPGNTFIFDEPDFALSNLKCIVLDVEDDTENDTVIVTFETETDGKYPYAYGQTASPPPAQELDPRDPFYVTPPLPGDWVITPRPPSQDGTQQPGFDLSGLVSNATATAIIVEWGGSAEGPWTQAYQGPPTVTNIPIVGLQSAATYYIAIQYQRNSNYSERYVYGPYVAPTLTAGVGQDVVDQIKQDLEAILDGSAEAEKVAEVLLETILNERDSLEAEAAERLENDTGVLNEAKFFSDGKLAQAMNTVYTRAQTDAGFASTLQSATVYTDAYKSQAQLLFSTKTERESGDASALLQAKSYTDAFKSEASLTYATTAAMGAANAATLSSAQSYSDGKVATALNTVYTKTQTDAGNASTLQAAKSYTDALQSYSTLNFSTKAELNGVSGQAALALSTAVTADGKVKAKLGFALQSGDLIGGMESENDGLILSIKMLSSIFSLLSTGSADRADFSGGIWYFYDAAGTTRTMVGRPFGGSHKLTMWTGPMSVPLGGEGKDNAYVYMSMNTVGGPRFGGSDVAGGAAPLAATTSAAVAYGEKLGGGTVTSNTITINVTGQGAANAEVRWIKTEEIGGSISVLPNGRNAAFRGDVPPGEMIRAIYLAVVTVPGGASVTVVQDVQLSDSN